MSAPSLATGKARAVPPAASSSHSSSPTASATAAGPSQQPQLGDAEATGQQQQQGQGQGQQGQQAAAPPPPPPLHDAAQRGDLNAMHALLETDGHSANSADGQGIPPLHWAAINGHLLACRLLLDHGATIDARAGELNATALQWAARAGHTPVVHLLTRHAGADMRLVDAQCFNTLHLAVHSSAALLVAYVLFARADKRDDGGGDEGELVRDESEDEEARARVDARDNDGHTALHWACYQGDALSVELLLKAGASPLATDDAGLSPLHWAAVKGNAACIEAVAKAGGSALARMRDGQGKTPRELARQLRGQKPFDLALAGAGLDPVTGLAVAPSLSSRKPRLANRLILALPCVALPLAGALLAHLPWFVGLPLAIAALFLMHHLITRVILGLGKSASSSGAGDAIQKSPYLAGIITASIGWVVYTWSTVLLPSTWSLHARLVNLFVLLGSLSCAYSFHQAVTLNPGHVPFPSSPLARARLIAQLVEEGSFDGMHFCVHCLGPRPLRSKHSWATRRCTARFDHYCPWIWNDGASSHPAALARASVFLRVLMMTLHSRSQQPQAVPALCRVPRRDHRTPHPTLLPSCVLPLCRSAGDSHADKRRWCCTDWSEDTEPAPLEAHCWVGGGMCDVFMTDTFALLSILWASLQLSWTVVLLFAQLWQVARQMTTLEVANVGRFGYMGGLPGQSARTQSGLIEKRRQAKQQQQRSAAAVAAAAVAAGAGGSMADDDNDEVDGQLSAASSAPPPADGTVPAYNGGASTTRLGAQSVRKATFLLRILGLDRFALSSSSSSSRSAPAATAHVDASQDDGTKSNPFDVGLLGNCIDFWTKGQALNVDYVALHSVPPGGFRRHYRGGALSLGRLLGGGGARRQRGNVGYERVATGEDRVSLEHV